jgi:hypothetical protein
MRHMTMNKVAGVILGATLLVTPALAAEQESEWEWVVTPYLFLPAVDADSTVAGVTVPVDLSFSDVWDNFDAMSLAARVEGWNGDWGVILDGIWTDVDGALGPQGVAKVDFEQWYIDALAGWRQKSETYTGSPIWYDLTAGLRYNSLKQQISLPAGDLGGTETWVDLMLGARYLWNFSDNWLFMARGDIGGFGWGDSSDLSASLTSGFGWIFSRNWSLDLGYRYYALDYETERNDGTFGIDGTMDGLWLGLTWKQ